ncbi:hypothetical protein IMZ48_37285 [Candidatus Bathyarchaeota archaeon]|nr:hypothetical protein [Candidatus Bathyarchaeota archaeon]
MPQEPPPSAPPRSLTSRRALNQFSLFAAGSAFVLASVFVTRRAVARRTIAALPKSFQPNVRAPLRGGDSLQGGMPDVEAEGGIIAAQALGLATLNVISFGIMAAGGAAFALDLSSVEDMRRYSRTRMYGASGRPDEEAEREMEVWAAGLLKQAGFKVEEEGKEGEDKPETKPDTKPEGGEDGK